MDEALIPLNRSVYVELEYDYEDEQQDGLNDLYSEYFYGDYDQSFDPPPPPTKTLQTSSNPFGVEINFDQYELSDIRNVEYDYDYDYENEVSNGIDADDEKIIVEEPTPPYKYKYKLISAPKESTRWTSTQMEYMGIQEQIKPHKIKYIGIQEQIKPHKAVRRPQKVYRPPRPTNPLDQLANFFQTKVRSIVEVIRKQIRLPRVVG